MEFEHLQTDHSEIDLKPFRNAIIGALRLKTLLEGERIADVEIETGYLHRQFEKRIADAEWGATILCADHLDPEQAFFGEWVLCLAIEKIAGLQVPPRARQIRILVAELNRISCHLSYIARMGISVGLDTVAHFALRDRERILDLFELLTGSRFSFNFFRFGGVREDVTEGFLERVLNVVEMVRIRLKEYNDIFSFNRIFTERAANVGIISQSLAEECGLTGPNLRACGIKKDLRKEQTDLGYHDIDFAVAAGNGLSGTLGDTHDRYLVRLYEISESAEIIKQIAEGLQPGPTSSSKGSIPKGEASAAIETARGVLTCTVVSSGGHRPEKVSFTSASTPAIRVLSHLLRGEGFEDLAMIICSLQISIPEHDK